MDKKCNNCRHWTRDANAYPDVAEEIWEAEYARGFGLCVNDACGQRLRNGGEDAYYMRASYDGGYTGRLVTHRDFGCNQWQPM